MDTELIITLSNDSQRQTSIKVILIIILNLTKK